jgi:hypothetical protein
VDLRVDSSFLLKDKSLAEILAKFNDYDYNGSYQCGYTAERHRPTNIICRPFLILMSLRKGGARGQ